MEVTDATDAGIYVAEGYAQAALSAATMIPGGKVVTTVGKAVGKTVKVFKGAEETAKAARLAEEAAKAKKAEETLRLEKEAAAAKKAGDKSGGYVNRKENTFKDQASLDFHYKKHADEFGNITKEQYKKSAQDLVNSKPGEDILTKTRPNGDTLYYNKVTNEFAVKTTDDTIRTYFKPTDGINYFNKQ